MVSHAAVPGRAPASLPRVRARRPAAAPGGGPAGRRGRSPGGGCL